MSEEKTKMKRFIENGMIKYARVPLSLEDELEERNLEVSRLKKLVDSLREQITQLEQEKQRYQLRDEPSDTAESYQIYK